MALSLATEQRLQNAGLIALFDQHNGDWSAAAQTAYDFVKDTFPSGSTIRQDDVSKALTPVFEVTDRLRNFLAVKKLTQKYWVKFFADLVIDRTWTAISQE